MGAISDQIVKYLGMFVGIFVFILLLPTILKFLFQTMLNPIGNMLKSVGKSIGNAFKSVGEGLGSAFKSIGGAVFNPIGSAIHVIPGL